MALVMILHDISPASGLMDDELYSKCSGRDSLRNVRHSTYKTVAHLNETLERPASASQVLFAFLMHVESTDKQQKNAAQRRRVGNMNHFRWKQLGHVCFGTIRYHFQSGFSDFAIFTWLRAHRLQSGSHCLLAWDVFFYREIVPKIKSVLNVIDGSW